MSIVAMLSGKFMAFVVEKQGGKSCEREEAQLLSSSTGCPRASASETPSESVHHRMVLGF
jgi:hypothetical protein